MGYNPYRKENGEFATKEEAGAKAGSDYDSAVASGDTARVAEIGDFVVENFPDTPKAQEILTSRYNPLAGTKRRISKTTFNGFSVSGVSSARVKKSVAVIALFEKDFSHPSEPSGFVRRLNGSKRGSSSLARNFAAFA